MEDDSGILEELQAQKKALQLSWKESKDVSKEEVILSASPFFSLEEHEGKLLITGIALAEGVWKNVFYPAEEIEKAAERLKGKPLKVEHGLDAEFQDKTVGKVVNAYYDKTLKSIVFQAEVTDPEAVKKVKDGTFPAVSCSTWVDKFPINSEQSIGFNFDFNELSLVKSPACEKCFIFAVEQLCKQAFKREGLNIHTQPIVTPEVSNMTEEEKTEVTEEVIEELETEVDFSELEKPKLYAVVEAESLSDFDELAKKKIVSYYYGYPYPYPYKGKYPYPHYPYYPYYGYPAPKKGKAKKPQKKSLWALFELESPEEIEALKKAGKKVVAVYYGYYGYPHYGYPYYGYPYYGYPYYGYPYYGYPGKKQKKLAVIEKEDGTLSVEEIPEGEDIEELKKKKKVVAVTYYGYYGYPYYGYPYYGYPYYGYPYYGYPYYGYGYPYYGYPEKKSEEDPEVTEALALLEDMALPKDYVDFMKKCMKESKTMPVTKRMRECAEAYKKQAKQEKSETEEAAKKKQECPAGQVWDEKEGKCMPIEKKEQYPAPEEKAAREWSDIGPGKITAPPGPAEQAKALGEKVKGEAPVAVIPETASATVKKEEQLSIPTVEIPMAQEPCKECPKEEVKQEVPKEEEKKVEAKVETPKEAPKEPEKPKEEPKVEAPKEEAKVEEKKEETKEPEKPVEVKAEAPKEEKKEPTEEEVVKFVKEHWAELIIQLRKEKKFP